MAWTTSDLTTIETAIRSAMTDGVASVSVGGQSVQSYTLKELRELRAEIKGELASDNANSLGGMRARKTIPPAAG
jgi:hypothetical protein